MVPWRDKGDSWRAANLACVLNHLEALDLGEVDVYSDGREGCAPFNRSAAYNRGVADHPEAEVYIFHEADMLIPAAQLRQAVRLAAAGVGMVVPFDTYHYLSPEDTRAVRAGEFAFTAATPESVMANGRSNGAVNVLSRATMEAVGCWDECFEGWGFDDRAMGLAFEVACHSVTRYVRGEGTHLWHKPGWSIESRFRGGADVPVHEHLATVRNECRYQRYRDARTPEVIRALTSGRL